MTVNGSFSDTHGATYGHVMTGLLLLNTHTHTPGPAAPARLLLLLAIIATFLLIIDKLALFINELPAGCLQSPSRFFTLDYAWAYITF